MPISILLCSSRSRDWDDKSFWDKRDPVRQGQSHKVTFAIIRDAFTLHLYVLFLASVLDLNTR